MVTQRIPGPSAEPGNAITRTPEGASLMPPRPRWRSCGGPVARLLPRVFVYGIRPERVAG